MLGFEDAQSQATLAGLWNAAYAVGWAAGPFAGGIVYELYQEVVLCMGVTIFLGLSVRWGVKVKL